MAQGDTHTPPTLAGNLREITASIEAIAHDLCDGCEMETMALLALCDDLRALALDNEEERPIPTARCLFCGEYFAHETGHTCEQLPRRAAPKEEHHGAA